MALIHLSFTNPWYTRACPLNTVEFQFLTDINPVKVMLTNLCLVAFEEKNKCNMTVHSNVLTDLYSLFKNKLDTFSLACRNQPLNSLNNSIERLLCTCYTKSVKSIFEQTIIIIFSITTQSQYNK